MTARTYGIVVPLVLLALALTLPTCGWAQQDGRPNILFIYTDDQAPTAVGVTSNREIKTPNLDRLFRQGAWLVNSFVTTPVCSPSRAGLIASRYGTELGITDWINPRTQADLGLDPSLVTWPQLLSETGYRTALVGKWHLGTEDRFHPTRMGYDWFMGFRAGGTKVKNPLLELGGEPRTFDGLTVDILTEQAIEFLRQNRGRTFLLSLHFRAPHAPWLPVAQEDWNPYADLDPAIPNPDYPHLDVAKIKRMTREYYASVSGVDRNVGRLLEVLDRLGLERNTVVVFTSDHGYNLGHNGVWYKGNARWQLTQLPPKRWPHIPRGHRPNLYDQSLRVATAIRWPAVIEPRTIVEQTITNLDWYPTLLAIAGVPIPQAVTIRGRNFLPLLRGHEIEWDNDLYAEYSITHGARTHMRAWRTPQWKWMEDFLNPGRVELYDLKNDPAESTNLAESRDPAIQAVGAELRQKLLAHMNRIGDPVVNSAAR